MAFNAQQETHIDRAQVLSKAVIKAGASLGLTQQEIADVIGRSRQRLRDPIRPETKEGQLALMLIRSARSLAVILGSNETMMEQWMRRRNKHLDAVPFELIQKIEGLARVTRYLDASRGKV